MRVDEDIEAIIAGRAALTHSKVGDVLFRPNDRAERFWILRSGRVEVTRQPRVIPHDPILVVAEAGWVVGGAGATLAVPRTGTATVMESTTATVIHEDRLKELFDRAPGLESFFTEFATRWDRRHMPPLPDAFGPLTNEAFDPPPKYATAVMPVPPLVPGETSYPPLRALPGRKRRRQRG